MSQAGQLLLGVFDGHGAQGRPVAHLVRDAIPVALEKVRYRAASPTASEHSSSSGDTTLHADGTAAADGAATDGAAAPNGRSKKKAAGGADGADRAEIHASRANALRAAFTSAEAVVRRSGVDHVFSGTTAVVAWLFGSEMYVAWVGDSRCSVGRAIVGGDSVSSGGAGAGAAAGVPSSSISSASSVGSPAPPSASSAASAAAVARRQRFRAVDVSHDQKPVRADEKKRVRDAGGRVARWRRNMGPLRVWQKDEWVPGLAMTRSIGDTCLSGCGVIPTPEVAYVRLNGADSFVVLASDGVWEFMTSQEVIDFVGKYRRQRRSAQSASDALVREAISRWRRNEAVVDDTTAVVLYLEWQHLRTPSGMPLPSAVAVDDGSSSVTGSGSGSASAASGAPSSASRRFFGGGGSSGTPSTSAVTSIDGSPVVVVTADQPRLVGRSGRLQRFEPKNELLLAPM